LTAGRSEGIQIGLDQAQKNLRRIQGKRRKRKGKGRRERERFLPAREVLV